MFFSVALAIALAVPAPFLVYILIGKMSTRSDRIIAAVFLTVYAVVFTVTYVCDVNRFTQLNMFFPAACFFGSSVITALAILTPRWVRQRRAAKIAA